ncbi:hypothetical protein SVIOM342S_06092 [Streptomyces violaceorubidus]
MAAAQGAGAVQLDGAVDDVLGGLGGESFAIAARFGTSGAPASYAVAAAYTIRRAASVRSAISATWWETAWRSRSLPPKASRAVVCARVASRAACAMPTAKAPTLGRNRLRVSMATRKPRSGSPSTSSEVTGTASKARVPMGCGESMSSGAPVRPGRSAGTRKAVTPRAPASGVVRAKTV